MCVIPCEGHVKVGSRAGVGVIVRAGQMPSGRGGNNSDPPLPPQQATLDLLVASSKDTDPGVLSGVTAAGGHLGVWGTVGIVAGAVGVGLGVGLTRPGNPPTNPCKINPNACR